MIDRAIKRVEDAGLLYVERSSGRRVNHYYITPTNPVASAGVKTANPGAGVHQPRRWRPPK